MQQATLYGQGNEAGFSKILGEAEYDAKMAGANMNKIRPLLQELFAKVKRK